MSVINDDEVPREFPMFVTDDEEEDLDDEEAANDFYDLEELDILSQQDNGLLVPLEVLLIEDNNGNHEDDDDGTVNPNEDPTAVDPFADDDEWALPAIPSPGAAVAGRVVSVAVGHGRTGRGRRRRGSVSGHAWSRGQPMLEKFQRDSDMPLDLQKEVGNLEASRARVGVARGAEKNDECQDVYENEDDEFNDCKRFTWLPMEGWQGVKETYQPRRPPGPTEPYSSAYDAFRAYWDDAIVSHIVTETNRYAEGISSTAFRRNWVDTNLDEIFCLLGFWMMLGIINMPSIKTCFSTSRLLYTNAFKCLFTEHRYWLLNRAFHLSRGPRDANDPLSPMGPVLDHLQARFQDRYEPDQNLCIDESLTLWKGPVSFAQYIKTKSARFGIKTFELCESNTGYLYSFFVYVGRKTTSSPLPSSASTVLRLVKPRLDLGHVLYMDNWFNSPQLARYLKRRRTDCVGTLRANRKSVPAILQRAPLADGEFIARQSGDVMLLTFADRKRVNLLSTYHGTNQVQTVAKPGGHSCYRLGLVADYNVCMGGVDRMDQMLEPYLIERKQCRSWTKKLFKRFLNISIQNARILMEKSSGKRVDSLAFRVELVKSILERHRPHAAAGRQRAMKRPSAHNSFPGAIAGSSSDAASSAGISAAARSCACSCSVANNNAVEQPRLTERHFITRIPVTEEDKIRIKFRKNMGRGYCAWCKWCGDKAKTYYHCADCDVPLCGQDKDCFIKYHTLRSPPLK